LDQEAFRLDLSMSDSPGLPPPRKGKSLFVDVCPETIPEHIVWWAITWTYPLWLMGGLYIVGSVLGWLLLALLLVKILAQDAATPPHQRISISWVIWLWILGMLIMQVALLVGHADYNYGLDVIVKSSIGWAKGWAALPLYLLAAYLQIRPEVIIRAVCIIGLQTLLIVPLLLIAPHLHLPEVLYVSPLKIFGGSGPEFFDVRLFEVDPTTDQLRWRLFAPWAPALGMVGNIYFMLSLQEEDTKWKLLGLVGAIVMCLICKSRLAFVCLFLVPAITMLVARLGRPMALIALGLASSLAGLFAPVVIDFFAGFWESFKAARADSTRVRGALNRIAFYRWETEAPIWGHGIVERGGHVVEWMPIGTHNTWAGLLFVKGLVGLLALAVPMLATVVALLWRGSNSRYQLGSVGFGLILILCLYSFGENLEILAYLYWPGVIVLGMALKEQRAAPIEGGSFRAFGQG
jgi:ABC-type multidrug transport system fused ATPase/permease subunit